MGGRLFFGGRREPVAQPAAHHQDSEPGQGRPQTSSYATRPTGGREVESMTMRQLATMRHPIVFLLGALAAVVVLVLYPIRVVDAADVAPPVEAETFDV